MVDVSEIADASDDIEKLGAEVDDWSASMCSETSLLFLEILFSKNK